MTIAEELRAEGEIRGKIEGEIRGQICLLEKLVSEGQISGDYFERTIAPLRKQLSELERK